MSKLKTNTIRHVDGSNDNITLDSSQNVTVEGKLKVGTSSTSTRPISIYSASDAQIQFQGSGTGTGNGNADGFTVGNSGGVDATLWNYENGYLRFATNNSEQLRIDSSGNVQIGTTAPLTSYGSSSKKLTIYKDDGNGGALELGGNTNLNAYNAGQIFFKNTNNANGTAWQSDSVLVGIIRAETITTDSNAGDDSGADLTFYTKPEAEAGALAMTIHGEGYVTKPKQPFFKAQGASSWVTVTEGDGNTIIPLATQISDVGNNYDTSTSKFTAPVDGTYIFHMTMYGKGSADASYASQYFMTNGSGSAIQYRLVGYGDNGDDDMSHDYTWTQALSANDYVQWMINADGDSWQYYGGHCCFSGYLIG